MVKHDPHARTRRLALLATTVTLVAAGATASRAAAALPPGNAAQ